MFRTLWIIVSLMILTAAAQATPDCGDRSTANGERKAGCWQGKP